MAQVRIETLPIETRTPRLLAAVSSDRALGLLLLLIVGTVTLVPIGYVLVQSFNVADAGSPFAFGLGNWVDTFTNPDTLSAIFYSIVLAVRTPIAIVIAVGIAWLLIRVEVPGHTFIEHALWFGFFLPVIPVTMGWILLLDPHYGLVNKLLEMLPFVHGPVFSIYSVPGIIWVHLSLTAVPVMVILLAPALRQMDAAIEEAADICGAGILTTLRRITVPLIAPAMLTAFIFGFIRSLEVFEVEQLIGTPVGIRVYATRLFDLVTWDPPFYPQAMALSALFLFLLLTIALIYQYYVKSFQHQATITGKGARLHPRVRTKWAYVASAALFVYVGVSILLPLGILVAGSFNRLFGFFFLPHPWTASHWAQVFANPAFARATVNSILLGMGSGLAGTLVFALIAWSLVRTHIPGRDTIALLTWLPWAIPGLVLGVIFSNILLNVPIVSILYGTMGPLVIAMIVKDMPIGVQMIRTSLQQVSGDLEEAAKTAGAGAPAIFCRITLPLIAPMCVAVFLLMFMSALRDISTVVLLASPGLRTLSLLMFQYATTSQLESAAVMGVIIAAISLLVTAIAFRIGIRMNVER
jgi:iron(III) transport system permease protein